MTDSPTMPASSYLNSPKGWKSWLLTVDHKRIGVMYFAAISFFFFLGGMLALLVRTELLSPNKVLMDADSTGNVLYLPLDQLGAGGGTTGRGNMPPVVTPDIGSSTGNTSRTSRREGRQ